MLLAFQNLFGTVLLLIIYRAPGRVLDGALGFAAGRRLFVIVMWYLDVTHWEVIRG